MTDINEFPPGASVYDDSFIIRRIDMYSENVIFTLNEENAIEMTAKQALNYIELCQASTVFTIAAQFTTITETHNSFERYGASLAAKMNSNFYSWCKSIRILGCFEDSFLFSIGRSLQPTTECIHVKEITTSELFRLSSILGIRMCHLKKLYFDCRCTYDSDFSSNVYQIVSSKISGLDDLFLHVGGFPDNDIDTMLHLIYAATTTGATVKILSEEHNTEEIANSLIRHNFCFGGAEMSFAAHYPHDVQHYATYFCKENDRFIMLGFLSP